MLPDGGAGWLSPQVCRPPVNPERFTRPSRSSLVDSWASPADFAQTDPMRRGHLDDPITGQHLTFLKTGAETGGDLLQVEVRLDAGGRVPRHVHLRQDERVEVINGFLAVRVGGQAHELRPGESLDVPRRRLPLIRNAADHEARFVLEVRPARHMEQAMRSLFSVMRSLGPFLRRTDSGHWSAGGWN